MPIIARKRLRFIVVLFLLLFMSVTIRQGYVQITKHQELKEKALENWDRTLPFKEARGKIVDRNGRLIVGNTLAPSLYFMPAQNSDIENVAEKLSPILQVDKKKLHDQLSKRTFLITIAPEGKHLTLQQVKEVHQLQLPGVYAGVDMIRYYPYEQMLARLLGFTGYDGEGLAGLEYQYNDYLSSTSSSLRLVTDAKGQSLPHENDRWKTGTEGANLQLTIDLAIQKVVERELSQAMEYYDAEQALALVADPNNGEILALSSFPSFDPLSYQSVSPSIYNQNLPATMTFEPGSTFKIITLAAALEEKKVNLQKEHFYDPGYAIVEGARLKCWKREGHKDQTFLEVVENSCNPGFIELGRRVGPTKLQQYIRAFGFGEKTNAGIAGESKGILFSGDRYGPVEHATTSFGQGISVTALQQVQAVSAAINGGKLYRPSIVKQVLDNNSGDNLLQKKSPFIRQVISEETSKEVREALESVVAVGSGRNAFRENLRIGGKTGTAQKVINGKYAEDAFIVSFMGFAPITKPQVVVYVAIDHPKVGMQFGGVVAAPIVGRIMEDIAPILPIDPQKGQLEKEYRWGDELVKEVPSLEGQLKESVLELQEPFKIEWHGTGSTIISQLPKAGVKLPLGGTIHLYLQ
ncbi:penicillin-binding transpeptidase domain-containing protein [Paenisporosarcina cavernae]|uniref:Stage V sporulation protein D n=1 Tax=Paenisporosarcina cavernae TaxID=2320858 RepID=A0A385YR18_9BACL|nr:penicillin-binding transpeptidase domain-containing protein [Paenisporosarcina cavernae]AYC29159.1 stage V sporulation protein D [Paenisporosarcina cavernae]